MNKSSFTAAGTLPIKIITDSNIIADCANRIIRPIHLQINPTNKCPLKCSFCSCDNRNSNIELDFNLLSDALLKYKKYGTRAVTITGGGDPLAYSKINELLKFLFDYKIDIGFVTNSILFKNVSLDIFKNVTWCRISVSDEQRLNKKLQSIITSCNIDWSFSYVITSNLNLDNLIDCIYFANEHKFTHLRLVDNILDEKTNSKMDYIKKCLNDKSIDDSIVIYQGRKQFSRGHKRCLLSLLKPNIAADGSIMPCCGVQYATEIPTLDYTSTFSLGNISKDIDNIYSNNIYFDGSICKKCYYSDYNSILNTLWDSKNIKHNNFI